MPETTEVTWSEDTNLLPGQRFALNKDPALSWGTHLFGMALAVVGLVYLVGKAADDVQTATVAAYASTLVLTFAASTAYHFLDLGAQGNRWLRRADHMAIYLLIAGSYVPALVHLLDGGWRTGMLVAMGAFALGGILFKLLWLEAPQWLSVSLYLLMGWSGVVVLPAMLGRMPGEDAAWMWAGGAFYSVGAIVYWREWPDPWPEVFGHHEIWHLFVIAGAACHFAFVRALLDLGYAPF